MILSAWQEKSMQFYEYKGCTIYPTPQLMIETGLWKIELMLRRNSKTEKFSDVKIFNTKAEAVFYCISYGKKLIDDGVAFLNVDV